jgi:hypothetical protein
MSASGAASPMELSRMLPIVSMIRVLTCECAWATLPLTRAGQAQPSRGRRTLLCAPSSPSRDSGGAEVNTVPGDNVGGYQVVMKT